MFGRARTIGFGLDTHARAGRGSRQPRQPFAGLETLRKRQSNLQTGLASLALHALVIGLAAWFTRADRASTRDPSKPPQVPVAVTMLYVPPKEVPPKPRPQHQPPTPPAPVNASPAPAPENPLPATTALRNLPEHDEPAATAPEKSSRPEEAETAEREDPMVSEARRIFGRKDAGLAEATSGPLQAGRPVGSRPGGAQCAWSGTQGSEADTPAKGVVEGIVRSESGGSPVAGALLQLLGTGSATFSDDAGHYRLTFDPSLVDRCRSQIVRVTAPGYRARNMVLAYGAWSDNTVDMAVR